MNYWTPTEEWKGKDAVIIGGGSSLKGFDFGQLQKANTIGCNSAFKLGADVVKFCLFCDAEWWERNKFALEKFEGRSVSLCPAIENYKVPWILKMHRAQRGLHKGTSLGMNYSTGAAAINLALQLGAQRVFLLGMDLGGGAAGETHWHAYYPRRTASIAFVRFIRGFEQVKNELHKFPGARVFNVTDGSSNLHSFERITFEEFRNRDCPQIVEVAK